MPMVEAAQQRCAKRFAVVAGPLVDNQPAARVELLLAVFQKAPGQVPGRRAMVGIEVDKQQVGLFRAFQQFQRIADADSQARIIDQAAAAAGMTVSGFETPDEQIRMLASVPEEGQLAYLRRAVQGTAYEGLPLLSAAAPFKAGGRQGWTYYTDIPAGANTRVVTSANVGGYAPGKMRRRIHGFKGRGASRPSNSSIRFLPRPENRSPSSP